MSNYKRVIYASIASEGFSIDSIAGMLIKAQECNYESGISGLLTYGSGAFLQVIEGFPPAIDKLLGQIINDPRHSRITIIETASKLNELHFINWSMALINLNEDSSKKITADLTREELLCLTRTPEQFYATQALSVLKRIAGHLSPDKH